MKLKLFLGIGFICLFLNQTIANHLFFLDSVPPAPPENWFNLDYATDGVRGMSTEKVYQTLLKGKTSKTVVVAIIDSGVDIEHEDLKDHIWVNPNEIAGNGIDDDKNGYIDDIHGWNFIGGADGQHVVHDTYELTRVYKKMSEEFKDVDGSKLKGKQKARYEEYLKVKTAFEAKQQEAQGELQQVTMILEVAGTVKKELNGKPLTLENVQAIETEDEKLKQAVQLMTVLLNNGVDEEVLKQIEDAMENFEGAAKYSYNVDFNPRTIIGDDYANSYEKGYGNNDVEGPYADHGTHVAGIIGADRNNGIGMKGVADNVKFMVLRVVPDGDERDKDVANAILYAAANGASVVNMSFGKDYSWDEEAVEKAIKYAQKKDVLLVHAAGNESYNTDEIVKFPNDRIGKKQKEVKNWLDVGALSWKQGDESVANFSNYGADNVDLFAPGVKLYSTVPQSEYRSMSGTSMASPAAAGVATMLRSYFPELTAPQVKEILMESVVKIEGEVNIPGTDKTTTFDKLCRTGGVINAYEAVRLAIEKTTGKKP